MKSQSIRKIWVVLGALALFGALLAPPAGAAERSKPNEARYIVIFKDSVPAPANLARTQAENRDTKLSHVYRHAAKGYAAKLTRREVEGLREDSRVKFVSRDHRLKLFAQQTPTGIERVFATENEALDIDEEDDHRADVDVAVIDSGIDHEHPDLDVVGGAACATEEEGSFECEDGLTGDYLGHGTHVAGTIGAVDNGEGVVGVAPGARLWSVQINLSFPTEVLESSAMAGVDWVTGTREDEDAENDIEVANMSFGCTEGFVEDCESLPALEGAISGAVEAGIVMVAAAGNEGTDAEATHPASHPDVITVSALEDLDGSAGEGDDPLASFSNYGETVEVAAPGVDILSTVPEGGYGKASGTSMASPHVAGAAALLAAADQPESKEDVEAIRDTIAEEGNLDWDDTSEDGEHEPLLDVSDEGVFAIAEAGPKAPTATTQAATEVTAEAATLNATVNPNGLATTYQLEYGTTTEYGSKAPAEPKGVGSGEDGVEVEEQIEGLEADTTYHFRVTATSEEGTSHGKDLQFTTAGPPVATTEAATGVTHDGATLNATVNPNDLSTTYQFEYGTTTEYGSKAPATPKDIGSGNEAVEVDEEIEGLQPGATYHFRVVAENEAGTAYGEDLQFTTGEYAFVSSFGEEGSGDGQLEQAWDLAIDPEGDIWVVDTGNHRVQQFNDEGEYLSQLGGEGSGNGQLYSPYGLAIDPEGNVWVADSFNHRVQKFNDEGEYLTQFGSKGSSNGQFDVPVGIAIDPEGNLWVVDRNNHRVQQISPGGEYLSQFGGKGSNDGQFDFPWDIAFDSNGDPLVVDYGNSRVQRFSPEGEYMSQFGEVGLGEGQFFAVAGIAVDPEGAAWIVNAHPNSHRVQKWVKAIHPPLATTEAASGISAESATLNATVNPNGVATTYQFEYGTTTEYGSKAPAEPKGVGSGEEGVEVDEELEGLELDTTYHFRVVAESADGTTYGENRQFTTGGRPTATTEAASSVGKQAPEEEGLFEAVLNATVDPNGLATTYQFEWGTTTEYGSKAPAEAEGIGFGNEAVEVDEEIEGLQPGATYHFRVVAENEAGTAYGEDLQFTTGEYAFVSSFGEEGMGNGQFDLPNGLAIDAEGDIWVSDRDNHRVQQFGPEGEYLSQFGEEGSGEGQFVSPAGIAVDPEGDIWVADLGNHRVQQFSPEGEYLSQFGEQGMGNGEFNLPVGIAIDPDGNLWVSDRDNHRVQQFSPEGEYLSQFGEKGFDDGQLDSPWDIAFDSNGDLLVSDRGNHRVQQFSPEGEYLSQFGEEGSGEGQFASPAGIAVDPEGAAWVVDAGNNRVQKWVKE